MWIYGDQNIITYNDEHGYRHKLVIMIDYNIIYSNQKTMPSSPVSHLLPLLLIVTPILAFQGCTNFSVSIGCLSCDNASLSYAYNQSQFKFTCTSVLGCVSVQGMGTCLACAAPAILEPISNTCINASPGCIQYTSSSLCVACQPTNYVLLNNSCYYRAISYCTNYTLNSDTTLGCLSCLYPSMSPALNCTFNASLCLVFDYGIMKCIQCANGSIVHSQGMGCYVPISGCLYHDNSNASRCLVCQTGQVYNEASGACVLGQSSGIDGQAVLYNISTLVAGYETKCLDRNKLLNTTTFLCTINALNHCIFRDPISTLCIRCLPGYYLNSASVCKQCSIAITNCASCLNSSYCYACASGYYLLTVSATQVRCMPCSSFGCVECSINFDPNQLVKCLSCPANRTLYQGSCMGCADAGLAYSIPDSKCLPCNTTIPNCTFCTITASSNPSTVCQQCSFTFYLNPARTACLPLTTTTAVTLPTAYEILRKVAPGSDKVVYGDKNALMSACNATDGFICRCNATGTTSLCNIFVLLPDITGLVFNNASVIAQYPDQLRMAAQLPTFDLAQNLPITTFQQMSLYQFWNLLSAFSFSIIRTQTTENSNADVKPIISRIFSHTAAMTPVLSDQMITILRGNGFYFKYIPKGLASGGTGDDDYISTTLSNAEYVAIYAYYSRLLNETAGLMTGTLYVYTNNPQANFGISVRKTRYYDDSSELSVKVENAVSTASNVSLSGGYFSIINFPKTTAASQQGVRIYGSPANATTDIYQTQRIQNIFYSQSWLYVLFFVALYLIFIPLCAIVDCCQTQQYMRKKVNAEQPSDNNPNNRQESNQPQDTTIVKVNYRDFFPLYNVGNTPRPRRLQKVCLFIVNCQHIVTFLTLVYFRLAGGIPVAAIALVIPAYLCTVIMGYLVGAAFRLLPGNFKYLINILSLGYWVLWIFLMREMANNPSREYRLFILVFSILSFFLDLTIDALETLLVYFAIKQGEKQISLFNCLAKWLSLRGYYQFDKLAKQLQGDQ